MTRERPIIMSAESVRAVLDGRKTQTRRVVREQELLTGLACEDSHDGGDLVVEWSTGGHSGPGYYAYCGEYPEDGAEFLGSPFGRPGDRLWVREVAAWNPEFRDPESIWYRADPKWDAPGSGYYPDNKNWRSPIHMPRWASRITLEVESVTVERLQDISTDDLRAEGIASSTDYGPLLYESFHEVWDRLNAKRGHPWDSNPWVWRVEFKRAKP